LELGEYTVGLLFLAGTWGASLGAAAIALTRLFPRTTGVPRVLAFGLLATATLIVAHLLPGAVGVLSRWTALVAALVLLAAVWRLVPQVPGAERDDPPSAGSESSLLSWCIAGVAVAAVACFTVAKLWTAMREASLDVDTLTFHLPDIGRWLQTGSIWPVDEFTPLLANGNYPHNGDLIVASVVAPFDSDAFVRAVNLPFVVGAGLAVYAIARELAAPRATAVLCGAVFSALPIVTYAAYDGAKTDPIMYACFGTGTLFLLRNLRMGRTGDLVLGGLGIGLAFGTKWYGATAAAVMVAVWAGAALLRRRGAGAVLREGAVVVGLVVAGGGVWLLRNAIASGSPLFPVAVPPVWDTPHDFVRECSGHTLAGYVGDARIWRDYVYPAYRDNFGLPGALALLGWVAAAAIVFAAGPLKRTRAAGTQAAAIVVVAVAGLVGSYMVTPYTALGPAGEPIQIGANTRWLGPALLLAIALLAWALAPLRRLRPAAEAVLLVAVLTGMHRGADVPARIVVAAAVALGLAGAAVYGTLLIRQRAGRVGRLVPVGAVATAVLVGLAIAFVRQRDYASDRFAQSGDPVINYLVQRATDGHRIAIAGLPSVDGLAAVWPAFGPDLDNRVEYLGRFVDGQLREYDDRAAWTRAVERGRYDLLVVGRGGYAPDCPLPGRRSDDDAWARAAGYRTLASTPRLTLYAVR
jgi:hypothetical protein